MDRSSLVLEQIRLQVQTNERMVDLLARRFLAVFTMAFATGASAVGAAMLAQVPWLPATLVAVITGFTASTQVRGLTHLATQLERGRAAAHAAIERLKETEDEHGLDAREPR